MRIENIIRSFVELSIDDQLERVQFIRVDRQINRAKLKASKKAFDREASSASKKLQTLLSKLTPEELAALLED